MRMRRMQWMAAGLVSVSMGLLAQDGDVVSGVAAALVPAVAEGARAPAAAEAAVAPGGAPAAQEEAPLELGRWTLGASFGEDLQVFDLGAMIPLVRAGRGALFLNPRGVLLEDEEQELNLGLVGRLLLFRDSMIVGANTFYDARWTEQDNAFHQLGGGMELLSRWFDARANYYYPTTDAKDTGSYEGQVVTTSGSRRTTTTTVYRTREEALEGFDIELGVWLPFLSRLVPTGVYAGYYDFKADDSGQGVEGFKARVEVRLHPNVTLDAEWFEETDYRRSETVAGVRLHLPLDVWNGVRMNRGGGRVPAFAARMDEPVQRDFRLRTLTTSRVVGTRTTTLSAARSTARAQADTEAPERVCRSYAALNDDGEVVIITVCE